MFEMFECPKLIKSRSKTNMKNVSFELFHFDCFTYYMAPWYGYEHDNFPYWIRSANDQQQWKLPLTLYYVLVVS